MSAPTGRRSAAHAALIVGSVFVWLAATAGVRYFAAPDEGRYAGVALAMLQSGDWLVPRLDGLPFFHKPPLFYWLSAASMAVFGPSEWSARLPSMLGGTLAAGALALFLRRWSDAPRAATAALVLVTMPMFYVGAQFANLDMLVAGWISACVLLAAHAALARERGGAWQAALAGAFACAALGVLAKGLIGFLLPGAVFFLWCLATRRARLALLLAWWPGWCIFVLLAAPWFVAMQLRYPGFFDYFVVTQHFRRFAASGFNNAHPFWFYAPVIAALALPWVGWLPVTRWRRGGARPPFTDTDWLMLIWFAVIVGFFSVPRSKLVGYVLPALPPLAWFVARALHAMAGDKLLSSARLRWTAGIAMLVCVAAVVAASRVGTPPGARLALPAGRQVQSGDQVLMLDAYFYEIPFYWKLRQPVLVMTDWRPASLASHDNWRNELSDAGRFEPALAASLLVGAGDLRRVLCGPKPTWLVGPSAAITGAAWLADLRFEPVTRHAQAGVWRFAGNGDGAVTDRCKGLALPEEGSAGVQQ